MDNKLYILDTSVILHNWNVLTEDRINIIPACTLNDIEKFQEQPGDLGDNARNASYWISTKLKQFSKNNISQHSFIFWKDNDKKNKEDKILQTAKQVSKQYSKDKIIILTKSISLRVKANNENILNEDYDDVGLVQFIDGWRNLQITPQQMQKITSDRDSQTFILPGKQNLCINQYIQCTFNNQKCNGMIYKHIGNGKFKKLDLKPHLASIVPKNPEQIMLANALLDKDIPLVSTIGAAGSGKTLIAIAAAIQQVLIKHDYKKIIITRPIMPVGKDIGYLPGDVNDKMAEWIRPFMDNIQFIKDLNSIKGKNKISLQKVGKLLNPADCSDIFQILPITYIRGSSINNAFIIVDEAQNATPSQMKTIITRVGQGSKLVLTGDVNQIDNRFLTRQCNGLTMTIKKFWNHDLYSHITLKNVERSKLADLATKLLF